ncbi:MAG: hypothetical protein ABH873_07110 [Candidatus Firestonebacteria bacterium]
MKKYIALVLIFCFVLFGCVINRYVYKTNYGQAIKKDDVVAASVNILQNEGFTITTANEKLGLITTEWKSLTNETGAAIGKILFGSAENRRVKISISVNEKTNLITMNPIVETSTSGWVSSTTSSEATMNVNEKKLIDKIAIDIATSLNLDPKSIEVIKSK